MSRREQLVEIEFPADISAVVSALAERGDCGDFVWLDSANASGGVGVPGRYSLIAWDPIAIATQQPAGDAVLRCAARELLRNPSAWALAKEMLRRVSAPGAVDDDRPGCGFVGYFGYELAGQLERLPEPLVNEPSLPPFWLAAFDSCVVLDHATRRAWLAHDPEFAGRLGVSSDSDRARRFRDEWRIAVAASRSVRPPCRTEVRKGEQSTDALRIASEQSVAAYAQRVRRALDYIAAGDIYQVNLSQRLRLSGVGDPLAAYSRLRSHNPAPFGALLRFADNAERCAVISASPELFLRLAGRDVLTSPIKGTRPRIGDERFDADSAADLIHSAKDAAELAMIVDLHRNDLGRVCEFGSVRVAQPRRLETHPRVLHTVADITGRLRAGCDAIDLLAACFPAGSITGVPKLRAMQIIREMEPASRGVFTGAIGWIGTSGDMTMNVAIRTVQMRGDVAVLHVGGGIVADSTPEAEYEETLAKARGVVEAMK